MIDQTVQETGLDAGPVGGHATDERPLIEIDEPDVRVGRRTQGGVFANRAAVFHFFFRDFTARSVGGLVVVLVALVSRGGGRGAGPPVLLHPLKGLVERPRQGGFALVPFCVPLDPLQQAPVV